MREVLANCFLLLTLFLLSLSLSLSLSLISFSLSLSIYLSISDLPGEPPLVVINGPTSINAGESALLECTFAAGDPIPKLEWQLTDRLPLGAVQSSQGDSLTLAVSNVMEKFCIACVGQNLEGKQEVSHCVDVLSKRILYQCNDLFRFFVFFCYTTNHCQTLAWSLFSTTTQMCLHVRSCSLIE